MIRTQLLGLSHLATLLVCAAPALAQQVPVDDLAAVSGKRISLNPGGYNFLGGLVVGPYDVENPPTPANPRQYGVEHAFGKFWVSGGDGDSGTSAGLIYRYDLNGNLEAQFPQTSLPSSVLGHRDGEADEYANKMWFGEESNRIVEYDYDAGTGALNFSRVYTLTDPLGGILPNVVRCLARNPITGRFYTANFGTPVWEFVLDPTLGTATVLQRLTNPTLPPTLFAGMAWDSGSGTLWGWAQNGSPALQAIELSVGATTLTTTGRTFQGQNDPLGSAAGGVDVYFDPRNPGFLSLVGMHQGAPDSISVYDLASVHTPPPYHDDCTSAALFSCGTPPANVSTLGATQDALPGCAIPSVAPGVWFKVAGTGIPITLSTCAPSTNFDTRISVFSGGCGSLVCEADNDDAGCGPNPLASSVNFPTTQGVEYLVLVHGGKSAADRGTFMLRFGDSDGDGTPDCADRCPNDPAKIVPGVCGCGIPETDSDGDGTPDCIDGCVNDPSKIDPGVCGCGIPDIDSDGDGAPDCIEERKSARLNYTH